MSPSEDSLWKDGKFKFVISCNEDYNMTPPKVKCLTKILHPNISGNIHETKELYFSYLSSLSASGDVCLSLLRLNSIDGMGWLPTRRLKDVVFGINSLFTDLCDFVDDPLNVNLAEEFCVNSEKVKQYVEQL